MTETPNTPSTQKKSNPLILIILIIFLLLAGAFFMMKGKKTVTNEQTTAKPTNTNVFTSIQDALSKSITLECKFSDETGRSYQTYVKNGAVRSDFTGKTADENGSVIMKDKKMYFWNSKSAMMMNFDVNEMQKNITPPTGSNSPSAPNGSNVLQTMEKFKDSCKPAVVADSLFTPPTNLKFIDLSEMMKPPTGTSTQPNATGTPTYNQQYIQDMMKKYAPSDTP